MASRRPTAEWALVALGRTVVDGDCPKRLRLNSLDPRTAPGSCAARWRSGREERRFLLLAESRHYSAAFIFALAAWAAAASAVVYLLNAFFGERIECKYTQLVGAIMFASGWFGVYAAHHPDPGDLLHRGDRRHHVVAVQSQAADPTWWPYRYPALNRSLR